MRYDFVVWSGRLLYVSGCPLIPMQSRLPAAIGGSSLDFWAYMSQDTGSRRCCLVHGAQCPTTQTEHKRRWSIHHGHLQNVRVCLARVFFRPLWWFRWVHFRFFGLFLLGVWSYSLTQTATCHLVRNRKDGSKSDFQKEKRFLIVRTGCMQRITHIRIWVSCGGRVRILGCRKQGLDGLVQGVIVFVACYD